MRLNRTGPPSGLLLLAAFLMAHTPAFALPKKKDKWIQLETAHLTLFSNAKEKASRRLAADLERLRALLESLFQVELNAPHPTYVFVFKNDGSFTPYKPVYKGKPRELSGYFRDSGLANLVAINAESRPNPGQIIYHEYIHYFVRNNFPDLPLWFDEGLAEFFSTFEHRKGELRIGLPVESHMLWLRTQSTILLSDLFAMDHSSKDYNEGTRRGVFYAQSWSLVHYLMFRNPEFGAMVPDYFAAVSKGLPTDVAFRRTFGVEDFGHLQGELHAYVRRSIVPYLRAELESDTEIGDVAVSSRPMEWPDVLYRLGDLLSTQEGQRGEAGEHFAAALEANPEHSLSLAGLGYLAELDERSEDARSLYQRAATLAPDEFLVQYRYGVSLREESTPEARSRAREAFSRATTARPGFGEAWAALGETYVEESDPPDAAVEALASAHRLLPSRTDVLHDLGRVHAKRSEFEAAIAAYDRVVLLDPKHHWALASKGSALRELGRHDEALASLNEAVRLDSTYAWALNERGGVYLDLEDYENAVGAYELAVQADPTYKWAHASRAQALRFLRRYEEALLALGEALRIDPHYEWALAERERVREWAEEERFIDTYNHALGLAKQGDHDAATAALEALIPSVQDAARAAEARELLAWVKATAK